MEEQRDRKKKLFEIGFIPAGLLPLCPHQPALGQAKAWSQDQESGASPGLSLGRQGKDLGSFSVFPRPLIENWINWDIPYPYGMTEYVELALPAVPQ